jgi:hypothetical protein
MANNTITKIIYTFVLIDVHPLKWLTIYLLIIHLIHILITSQNLRKGCKDYYITLLPPVTAQIRADNLY